MAAKTGDGVKIKHKFFDRDNHEVKPVHKEGRMFWYCEQCNKYNDTWFSKQIIKLGGRA